MISMIGGDRNCSGETPSLEKGAEEEIQSTICLSKTQISNEVLNHKRWEQFLRWS